MTIRAYIYVRRASSFPRFQYRCTASLLLAQGVYKAAFSDTAGQQSEHRGLLLLRYNRVVVSAL